MAEATPAKPAFRASFHFWIALAMCLFVFGGFGATYIMPIVGGSEVSWAPIVHLHGAVFFSWMVLLVVQSGLVNVKNVKLHRSLGTFGIGLATLVAFMGFLITMLFASVTDMTGDAPGLFYLSLFAPPGFLIIFAMAIRAVRRPVVHRGLMLMATTAILMPGINRFYMAGLGLPNVPFVPTYLTMDVLLAAILWHERKSTGAISRTSWAGIGVVVVPQLFNYPVSGSEWFTQFVFWLGSLVHYP